MKHRLALLVLALAASGASAEPAAPLRPIEKQSLDDFAAANGSCREWSDGCAVCVRRNAGFACSTPGIACTPSHLVCRTPLPPPVAKP